MHVFERFMYEVWIHVYSEPKMGCAEASYSAILDFDFSKHPQAGQTGGWSPCRPLVPCQCVFLVQYSTVHIALEAFFGGGGGVNGRTVFLTSSLPDHSSSAGYFLSRFSYILLNVPQDWAVWYQIRLHTVPWDGCRTEVNSLSLFLGYLFALRPVLDPDFWWIQNYCTRSRSKTEMRNFFLLKTWRTLYRWLPYGKTG